MILHEIEILNFRQFYGQQRIEFADGDQNITILFGDNGKGKTGIFRALMYGLYGSKYIQQDNTNDQIHLVNLIALEEKEGQPVTSSVTLYFSNNGRRYRITRTLKAIKSMTGIVERDDRVELRTTDENGNFSPEPETDVQKVNYEINKVLNEDIKDFFLFDAEKIDTLAKTDSKVKQEVKTAIFKLLQIENVEKAISILQSMYTKQNKSIVENSKNVDIERKSQEIDQTTDNVKEQTELLDAKETNLRDCREEMVNLEKKLAENTEIKALQEIAKKEEEILKSYEGQFYDKKKLAHGLLVQSAPKLIMRDHFINTGNYLDQIVAQQDSIVPIEVLEKSLSDEVCACCNNDLETHTSNLNYVRTLKENYKRSFIVSFTGPIKSMIVDSNNQYDQAKSRVHALLQETREIRGKRDSQEVRLDEIKEEISKKASAHKNIADLEMTYKKVEQDAKALEADITSLKYAINENEKSVERLQKELERMMGENEALVFDSKILAYINELRSDIRTISDEFSTDMRDKLKAETTKIFKLLIDQKDKELVKQIEINEKFEIEIIGWDHTEITQDISQGQRQIVAISFISALAKVAAGEDKRISFPMFMDAPFGRISGNNRDHLINNLPDLTSQWILLLTDTELTHEEERVFKETGKLGKWYKLEQERLYHSKIVELDISEVMATRG